ncbi:hypothetical protein [Bradyrhizobium cosmicum]|uniref:hypothetical protein n=1 Tax=Bradyrhizobium cosmicum TaxID=1404864 RepID=UPI0028EB663D|nr:hypothetical protein [Bradyrhizobium cosmicum]
MTPVFDVGYRLVAVALSVCCARQAWHGLIARKIRFVDDDWLDWSRWASQVFHRDTMPIRYWMQLSGTAISSLLCLAAAFIGWWQPNG